MKIISAIVSTVISMLIGCILITAISNIKHSGALQACRQAFNTECELRYTPKGGLNNGTE